MLWLKFGWRNLWRNRRRTIIELISISGGVFLALFFNNLERGGHQDMIEQGVRMGSGHIGIYHPDYLQLRQLELTVEAYPMTDELERIPQVVSASPRLHVPGLVQSARESRAGIVLGIEFDRERLIDHPFLRGQNLAEGEIPAENDIRGAMMGFILAEELGLDIGRRFVIMSQGPEGIASELFRVRGLIRTGAREIDANTVLVHRQLIGRMLGNENAAHEIALMVPTLRQIGDVLPAASEIAAEEENARAYRWEEAMPDLVSGIQFDYVGSLVFIGLLYLLVGIGTLNTLLMSVMERTREFGVIRALGLGKAGIMKIVTSEALVLGLTGISVGFLLAVLVGLYTSTRGIDFSGFIDDTGFAGTIFDPVIHSIWDWPAMFLLMLAMLVLVLAASLYPVTRILKIKPSEAMKKY